APEQFGFASGPQMAKGIPQYSVNGTVTFGVLMPILGRPGHRSYQPQAFSFTNYADVIDNKAGIKGQLPGESVRAAQMRMHPGRLLLEIESIPQYSGDATGTITLPIGQPCPGGK